MQIGTQVDLDTTVIKRNKKIHEPISYSPPPIHQKKKKRTMKTVAGPTNVLQADNFPLPTDLFFRNGLVVPPTIFFYKVHCVELLIMVGSVKSGVGDFSDEMGGFLAVGTLKFYLWLMLLMHSITNNYVGCRTNE